MAYKPSISSTITLSTSSTTGANLGATVFIASGFFTKTRTKNYSSIQEIRDDATISVNSNIYKAALTFFSQTAASVPWYISKRLSDDITFTPTTISNSAEYSFDIEVYDTTTLAGTEYTVSVTSDATATAAEIATLLHTEIDTTQAIPNLTSVDNTGSITLTPDSGYSFVVSNTSTRLTESYTTTETAATVFSATLDEIEQDFYFVTAEDKTKQYILDMAAEVESTSSSDWPKYYRVSTSDVNTLKVLPDPADDVLGELAEFGYLRTAGEWHHSATTVFPELAPLAIMGSRFPGSSSWKFLQLAGIEAAEDPVTGLKLTTAQQGYIRDRNGSWYSEERGVNFLHGGTGAVGTSAWTDLVRASDWITDTIEVRLLNLQLNTVSGGSKISFTDSDKQRVLGTINGVLSEAVTRKILSGYVPASIKVAPSFTDQVARTLDDIEFIGYLAGNVHFIVVNGNLTYADEALA